MRKQIVICRLCRGSGVLNDYVFSQEIEVCPDCEGTGELVATAQEAKFIYGEQDPGKKPE